MIIREVDVHDKENFMVHPGLVDLLQDTEVPARACSENPALFDIVWNAGTGSNHLGIEVIQSSAVTAEKQ